MKKLLSIAALLTVSLLTVQESQAKGNPGNSGNHSHFHSYSSHYRNWSSYSWNSRYGCYFYGCPYSSCSYYWYAPGCCYYPTTYLAQYPPTQFPYQGPVPTQFSSPIQVTNVNTNTLANNSPGIPVTPGFVPKGP